MLKNRSERIKSNLFALFGAFILILADQLTKYLASLHLKGTRGISLIPDIFRLYYLENSGAAFGALSGKQVLLIIVSIVAFVLFVYFYERFPFTKRFRPLRICLTILAAGALGNMIDRIIHHYVIDFFYFELINFPVFNVADCYVCVSMVILACLLLFYYKEEELKK